MVAVSYSVRICYSFSRAASASAAPEIGDIRALNKIVRTARARPQRLMFYPLKGNLRLIGYPDASYQNNTDSSSQRGQVIFLAEQKKMTFRGQNPQGSCDSHGSLIEYESTKTRRTTLSTTVAELYSFMKCYYGTCLFLKGLWKDISGQTAELHMRTAHNLVTTAKTTHLPEQKETTHMIQMLRRESCSGNISDLSHVRTEHCLSDCLTMFSAKPDNLLKAVATGILPAVNTHPNFRDLISHKAFMISWIAEHLQGHIPIITFFAAQVLDGSRKLCLTSTEVRPWSSHIAAFRDCDDYEKPTWWTTRWDGVSLQRSSSGKGDARVRQKARGD
mgnify:CR=1 FL=1